MLLPDVSVTTEPIVYPVDALSAPPVIVSALAIMNEPVPVLKPVEAVNEQELFNTIGLFDKFAIPVVASFVPLFSVIVPVPAPAVLKMFTVPAVIVMPPVKVLTPLNVSAPVPVLTKFPAEMMLEIVPFPVTVIVPPELYVNEPLLNVMSYAPLLMVIELRVMPFRLFVTIRAAVMMLVNIAAPLVATVPPNQLLVANQFEFESATQLPSVAKADNGNNSNKVNRRRFMGMSE